MPKWFLYYWNFIKYTAAMHGPMIRHYGRKSFQTFLTSGTLLCIYIAAVEMHRGKYGTVITLAEHDAQMEQLQRRVLRFEESERRRILEEQLINTMAISEWDRWTHPGWTDRQIQELRYSEFKATTARRELSLRRSLLPKPEEGCGVDPGKFKQPEE